MKILFSTASVCPVCRQRVPAAYIMPEKKLVQLKQVCPAHGSRVTDVWRGESFLEWCGGWRPDSDHHPDCPSECGLCGKHRNQTCCGLLNITERCNLGCPYCFADNGKGADLSFEKVCRNLDEMFEKGIRFLHVSGGEPTLHPKLSEIISYAAQKGFYYIQLNTNGIRIAEDARYTKTLADAGLSSVFLQFDGLTDEIYLRTRNAKLLDVKKRAVQYCEQAELGVVLVPTIVPGINDTEIGNIIRYAYRHAPTVRGVHFQPVTYTGRYAKGEHFTMPQILEAIEEQTNGFVKRKDFQPSSCDAPLCGFHAEYKRERGQLAVLGFQEGGCCNGAGSDLVRNQLHVKNRWTRVKSGDYREGSFAAYKKEMSDSSFFISGMLFQDAENIDLGRVMNCSLHVFHDGKVIPFCIYYNHLGEK
ncbi:MAG: radical SAM protein [Eubacterium sp.]|jgi:Predicted Fe-S oxidoreductases|nr:radical SAM protein [Eubacterium sp.]